MEPSRGFTSTSTASVGSQHPHFELSKVELCCELQLNSDARVGLQAVSDAATSWLASGLTIALGLHDPRLVEVPLLAETCTSIRIEPTVPSGTLLQPELPEGKGDKRFSGAFVGSCRSSTESEPVVFPYCQAHITILPYFLHDKVKEKGMGETGENGGINVFTQWPLPNTEFESLWESLHFEKAIKETLLEYTLTALLFSDKNVDPKVRSTIASVNFFLLLFLLGVLPRPQLITWNRVVFLHGPPGSGKRYQGHKCSQILDASALLGYLGVAGKTSLCKALAQKLSIRLSRRFTSSLLLSINAPSLFSRWFSESGKMVMKVFYEIRGLVKNKDCLVVILIDEVESLSASRAAAAPHEPSDSVRVVNALLTQIDMFEPFPNALVLTTSNLAGNLDYCLPCIYLLFPILFCVALECCDAAFIDRADLKLYVPSPNANCRYDILIGCIQELVSHKSVTLRPVPQPERSDPCWAPFTLRRFGSPAYTGKHEI